MKRKPRKRPHRTPPPSRPTHLAPTWCIVRQYTNDEGEDCTSPYVTHDADTPDESAFHMFWWASDALAVAKELPTMLTPTIHIMGQAGMGKSFYKKHQCLTAPTPFWEVIEVNPDKILDLYRWLSNEQGIKYIQVYPDGDVKRAQIALLTDVIRQAEWDKQNDSL